MNKKVINFSIWFEMNAYLIGNDNIHVLKLELFEIIDHKKFNLVYGFC